MILPKKTWYEETFSQRSNGSPGANMHVQCPQKTWTLPSNELFNDWGERGYDDCVPEEVTKTAPSEDRTT